MKYLSVPRVNIVRIIIAMTMTYIFLNAAQATEIPLVTTDNGTDTGWVAIINDADFIVFTSIIIPSPNNLILNIEADVHNELHIRFKQKDITNDFAGFDDKTQTSIFIEGVYTNTGVIAWTGAKFDSRDGLGRTIKINEKEDHPGSIHYHGPVGAHVVYNLGDSLFSFDGLWNPTNHPFGEVVPILDPDYEQEIGLGVKSVTLCGNGAHANSVAPNKVGHFLRQRLHIQNPDTDISDDRLSEAEKKAQEKAKKNGLIGYKLASFDYWFSPNPDTCSNFL